jgi:hypothetical protein
MQNEDYCINKIVDNLENLDLRYKDYRKKLLINKHDLLNESLNNHLIQLEVGKIMVLFNHGLEELKHYKKFSKSKNLHYLIKKFTKKHHAWQELYNNFYKRSYMLSTLIYNYKSDYFSSINIKSGKVEAENWSVDEIKYKAAEARNSKKLIN